MPDDREKNDAKNVWRGQPTSPQRLTAALIEQRARDLRARTQRKEWGAWAGPAAAGLLYAYSSRALAPLGQLPHSLFALAVVWSLTGLSLWYWRRREAPWAQTSGLTSGLEFCRLELMRQRDLVRRSLAWLFGPMLLSIGAFVLALAMAGAPVIPNGLPFLVLVAVWIGAALTGWLREERALRSEIEELTALVKESHP